MIELIYKCYSNFNIVKYIYIQLIFNYLRFMNYICEIFVELDRRIVKIACSPRFHLFWYSDKVKNQGRSEGLKRAKISLPYFPCFDKNCIFAL